MRTKFVEILLVTEEHTYLRYFTDYLIQDEDEMISMLPRSRRLKVALSMNLNDLFPIMLTKHMVFVTLRDDKPSNIQSYL